MLAVAAFACGPVGAAPTTFAPALRAVLAGFGADTAKDRAAIDAYIAAHPKDGDGYAVRCGLIFEFQSNDPDARKAGAADCGKALQLAPDSSFVHVTIANVLYDAGNVKGSLQEYSRAIALGETRFGVFWKRCDAERRTGDFVAAKADCDRQIELTPGSYPALYSRGVLEDAQKNYESALVDFDTALAMEPKNIDALYWRGIAFEGLQRYQEAEADYSQALKLGDQSADTRYHRGNVYMALKRYQDAANDYATAMLQYTVMHLTDRAKAMRDLVIKAASLEKSASPSPTPSPAPHPSVSRLPYRVLEYAR